MYIKEKDSFMPNPDYIQDYLKERGISEAIANTVGFKLIDQFEWKPNSYISGLNLPYFSPQGELWSHRVRVLPPDWEANPQVKQLFPPDDLPKFLSKKGTKNKPYLSPIISWPRIFSKTSQDIILTEGEIKATVACVHQFNCIGLNGIWGFLTKQNDFSSIFLPELEQIDWQNRSVGICFDSDIIDNHHIKLAAQKLATLLLHRGAHPYLIVLPKEINGSKNGLDDFILRHGAHAFSQLVELSQVYQQSEQVRPLLKKKIFPERENPELKELRMVIEGLEPISAMKGLMSWTVLKEDWQYRPGCGWYHWNSHYWQSPQDGKNGENQLLSEIRNFRFVQKWIKDSHDKLCLDEFVKLKNNSLGLTIDWNPQTYLAFENGYLNTQTNEFTPPIKEAYVTNILPFDYQPHGSCPQWLNFLDFTFRGDQQKIEYLRAWMRWILSPKPAEDYPIEATLWIIGNPGYGKGTFFSVLMGLVGKENMGIFEPNDINNANKLYALYEKKLAINTDVDAFIQDIPLYNRICSNEPISLKNLYHNCFAERLRTVTVLGMNKEVSFKGAGSEGLQRRLHVIRFERKPENIDQELKQKLKQELSGIFAWVWGLSYGQTKRILNWRIVEDVQSVYESSHPEIEFLREFYPEGISSIKASVIYSEYADWCQENGYSKNSIKNFVYLISQIKEVKKTKARDGSYYQIPKIKNYFDWDSEKDVTLLPTVEHQSNSGGYDQSLVEDDNPDTETTVQDVVDKSAKVFACEAELENQNQVFFPNHPQSCTSERQSSFQPSTLSTTAPKQPCTNKPGQGFQSTTPTQNISPEILKAMSNYDLDIQSLIHSAKSTKELAQGLMKLWSQELELLGKSKEWSSLTFQAQFQTNPQDALLTQWCQFIHQLRNLRRKPRPIMKTPSATKDSSSKTGGGLYFPQPPEFRLGDVLPHLEPGKGKHKRNYVCPCCHQDYLSVKEGKGYKCWNPKSDCDTKEIFKQFIAILKEKNLSWQRYQSDLDQWRESHGQS